jgi:hypothetical protein
MHSTDFSTLTPEQRSAVRDAVGTVRRMGADSKVTTSTGDIASAYREVCSHAPLQGWTTTENVIWGISGSDGGCLASGTIEDGEALHG